MSSFDSVTTWTEAAPGRFVGTITDDWMQGRAAFGGVLTTGCVRLAMAAEPDRPVRTVDARFFEPVEPGAIEARVEVLRSGRSVAHVQVEVWQQERRCMRSVVCLAGPRASRILVDAPPSPGSGERPDDMVPMPYLPGLTPVFTQHVEIRFLRGIPFMGSSDPSIEGWCRFKEGASGIAAVVGLVDVWPAPVLSMATGPAPASTVHWTLHLLGTGELDPTAWYRYRATTLHAGDGSTTFEAWLWDAEGEPVAWSEQLAVVFDQR